MVTTEGIWTLSPEAGQILCQSYATGRALVLGRTPAFCSIQVKRFLWMLDLSSLARVAPSHDRYRTDHVSDMSAPAHGRLPHTCDSKRFAGSNVDDGSEQSLTVSQRIAIVCRDVAVAMAHSPLVHPRNLVFIASAYSQSSHAALRNRKTGTSK